MATAFNWTYTDIGVYDVAVTVTTSEGCYTVAALYQYITVDCINEVEELRNDDITVFPNPAQGKLYIDFAEIQGAQCTIYNITGKEVIETQQLVMGKSTLNITDLIDGIYFIRIEADKRIITRKLLVGSNL
jgi:hypothetical protein